MHTKIQVTFTPSQQRQGALVRQGLSPKAMSIKRQTQVQRNRKEAAKSGYHKHKARGFDCA